MHSIFKRSLAMIAAVLTLGTASVGFAALADSAKVGLQSWTCRNMTFGQVVAFAVRHEIKHVQFISAHLDPLAPAEENAAKKQQLDQYGIIPYAIGVTATTNNKESNRRIFEFARQMGTQLIVVEPKDPA